MKVFKLFLCVLAITLAGCDSGTPGDLRVQTSIDDVEQIVPFRGEFVQVIDPSGGFLDHGIPALFNLQGHATALGALKDGTLSVCSCHLNSKTGVISGTVKGVFIGVGNDEAYFSGTAYIYPDGSGGGYFNFEGGTGTWKAIDGWFATASTTVEAGAAVVTADGEIDLGSLRSE